MHRSRLAQIVIDCEGQDIEAAARFWSGALGRPATAYEEPEYSAYRKLKTGENELNMLVQRVDHPGRVHLDIETDDVEAEVRRLEELGARRVRQVKDWWVMEAPTGQRFCVMEPQTEQLPLYGTPWE
ncbi:MAG: VOC family protein [Lysobacteraceae bacterium]|nr:MAG: VOC family protein [Xanthomonadaceae bacterium]